MDYVTCLPPGWYCVTTYFRCCEVMKNLEMWVGILELNDQGSYVPVSIEERKDVKTGGVYVLRQVVSPLWSV